MDHAILTFCKSLVRHLTIRLRARDFYVVIVDEGEAKIESE